MPVATAKPKKRALITDPGLPKVDPALFCPKCKSFLIEPSNPGVVLCPNGHGRLKPVNHSEYQSVAKLRSLLPWLKNFGSANETPQGFVIGGLPGYYKKTKPEDSAARLADHSHPPDGFVGGRIGDKVFCFKRRPVDEVAAEGYQPLAKIGSRMVWDGDKFPDDHRWYCDGVSAIDWNLVTDKAADKLDAAGRNSQYTERSVSDPDNVLAPYIGDGLPLEMRGWKEVENKKSWRTEVEKRLFVTVGNVVVEFDAERAGWMRRALLPGSYTVVEYQDTHYRFEQNGKKYPPIKYTSRILQFRLGGQVVGFLNPCDDSTWPAEVTE